MSLQTKFKLPTSDSKLTAYSNDLVPVRVKDIILDNNHPEILSGKFDKTESIGLIKYSLIDRTVDTDDIEFLPYAFPLNNFNTTLPLINEVVFLVKGPKYELNLEKVDYYISTVSLWNDINHIPSQNDDERNDVGAGYDFKVNDKIRPLHPFHGDTILQGRLGQSIRLTGAKSPKNTLSNDTNANSPLTIISNGHQEISTDLLYVEDINKDLNSIYLASDHKIPLKQSRTKYAGASERPILSDAFKGNQTILNSGRIFLNASKEDVQISSLGDFGVTSNNVSIDGVGSIGLDAKEIYLGEDARRFKLQPVILGDQLEVFLQTLLKELEAVGKAMKTAKTIDQKIIPKINKAGIGLEGTVKVLQNRINPGNSSELKSKKVYTE